jgi:hypothetical protein
MTDPRNLGCIDPHGMYPFPASREVCPKCQAIRAAQKPGLPFGWWKDPGVWASVAALIMLGAAMVLLFLAWFLDWKPWW